MKTSGRFSTISGLKDGLFPPIGTIVIDSVPPATMMSAKPAMIRSAAMAIDWRPEEQNRLIVIPGTESGSPAFRAQILATFIPCSPSGIAQPRMTSSTRAGSRFATRSIAPRTATVPRSSGRVSFRLPRYALPIAVRTAEMMYALAIGILLGNAALGIPPLVQRLVNGLTHRFAAGTAPNRRPFRARARGGIPLRYARDLRPLAAVPLA